MSENELGFSRWWLVVVAGGVLGLAGLYQFVWSSIRVVLDTRLETSEAVWGSVFTIFIISQTISQFPGGWVRDRLGPKYPLLGAVFFLSAGYLGIAFAPTIYHVFFFYTLGGIGAGLAYTVAVNTPVKWFDDYRGLATGLVGVSYGGLSFLMIPLLRPRLTTNFAETLFLLALLTGGITLVAVPILKDPSPSSVTLPADHGSGQEASSSARQDARPPYTWRETVRTWQFWLLYGVFVIVNAVGLMLIEKAISVAELVNLSPAVATGAASLIAMGDGAGVALIGSASDRFGRERTAGVSLLLSGGALVGLVIAASNELADLFLIFAGVAAFFRSPPFSIFPSLVGDYYGTAHSSENYAVLYTAKIWGGVLGGTVSSVFLAAVGWQPVFLLAAGLIAGAGLLMFVLKPT